MRKHRVFGVSILVGLLTLAMAGPAQTAPAQTAPAQAAPRLRLYRGETSQGFHVAFVVARTDAGRFVREVRIRFRLTCEDQTTQDFVYFIIFGKGQLPMTDGAFSYDEVAPDQAFHLAGDIGSLLGQGTLTIVFPALTADEQAQLCTTGDLTWEVEFARIIRRGRAGLHGSPPDDPPSTVDTHVRLGPQGHLDDETIVRELERNAVEVEDVVALDLPVTEVVVAND